MRYLLDTNACIQLLKLGAASRVGERYLACEPGEVFLCSVVKAELYFGAHRSRDRARNLSEIAQFCAPLASLPFDDQAAHEYGMIRAALIGIGTPIGPNDLLVAAIAVANGLTVVTHNTSEFSRVSGLTIEDWEV